MGCQTTGDGQCEQRMDEPGATGYPVATTRARVERHKGGR